MKKYCKIISILLIVLFVLSVNGVSLAYYGDEDSSEAVNAELSEYTSEFGGQLDEAGKLVEGRINNSYHYGKLMTVEEKEAVLDALEDSKLSPVIEVIHAQMLQGAENIYLDSYSITPNELHSCYQAIMNNYPDMYFAEMGYSYTEDNNGFVDLFVPEYAMTADERAVTQAAIDEEVKNVLACIEPGMNRMDQVTAVNDYFASHYTYDYEHLPHPEYTRQFMITALFIDKTAVCQGFGLGFQYIMEKLNIPCVTVQSEEMNHLWNLVQAKEGSENWYHIDVTWNTQYFGEYSMSPYIFFLKSDSRFEHMKEVNGNSNHYGFIPYGWATDEAYDDNILSMTSSKAVYLNGGWYFVKSAGAFDRPETVYKYNFATGEGGAIVSVEDEWMCLPYPDEYPDYTYLYESLYFSSAEICGSRVYYNDATNVYVLDPMTGESTILYSLPKETYDKGYSIYGIEVKGDTLIYKVSYNYIGSGVEPTEYTMQIGGEIPTNKVTVSDGILDVILLNVSEANNIIVSYYDDDGRFVEIHREKSDGVSTISFTDDIPDGVSNVKVFATKMDGYEIKPVGESIKTEIP